MMRFKNRLLLSFCVWALPLLMFVFASCEKKQEGGANKIGRAAKSKTINIVSNQNGVGLSQDIEILQTELVKLGHKVNFIEDKDLSAIQKADINVLIQPLNLLSLPYADRNYLIPNPEWCWFTAEEIAQFDMILCKTREAERIYTPLNSNTVFMGFTCKDRYDPTAKKNYKAPFHLAGKSTQKGTDQFVKTWLQNPQWPQLTLVKYENSGYPPGSNIRYLFGYLPAEELRALQNSCGLHICPSETEGFGYYIMEGLSCGSVVAVTDAPPMNEFVQDKRCLMGVQKTAPMQLATNYYVDPKKLDKTVSDLLSLSEEELKEIGSRNRQFYLENDRKFKERVAEIFSTELALKPKFAQVDPNETAFSTIYSRRLWADNPSGEGSTPENTKFYRYFLQNFLADQHIQSVVEIGCGDWGFSKLMDWKGINYTGYDICRELVETNRKQFGSSSIQFRHGNGLRLDLPQADLLICKDVLQHLPNQEVLLLPRQLKKYKHVLLINDVDPATLSSDNPDILAGEYRLLDLNKPPFNLVGQKVLTFTCGSVTKQVLYIRNEL